MSLPQRILSDILFANENKLGHLAQSSHIHERLLAAAVANDEDKIKQELSWAFEDNQPNPFAKTNVGIDGHHHISAAGAALVAGHLPTLKIMVAAQQLSKEKLGPLFEDAAWALQKSQTTARHLVLKLDSGQKDCLAWLMSRGLDLRDHLPSLAVHERTSGRTLRRSGEHATEILMDSVRMQAEQTVELWDSLRARQQAFQAKPAPDALTPDEKEAEVWQLVGHTCLRWRLDDQTTQWLAEPHDRLPDYPGTRQPHYLARALRDPVLVDTLINEGLVPSAGAAAEIIDTVHLDQINRQAQLDRENVLNPMAHFTGSQTQRLRLIEQEVLNQQALTESLLRIEREAAALETWPVLVENNWIEMRQQVNARQLVLDEAVTTLMVQQLMPAEVGAQESATDGVEPAEPSPWEKPVTQLISRRAMRRR